MTSQDEYILNEIHTEVTQSKLWPKFNAQLKKMSTQKKHQWKSPTEKWEYALNKIKSK